MSNNWENKDLNEMVNTITEESNDSIKTENIRQKIYIFVLILLSVILSIIITNLISNDLPGHNDITENEEVEINSRFDILTSEKISDNLEVKIIIDRDTDVEYIMTVVYEQHTNSHYIPINVTINPLYNSDGSLKLRE